MALRAARFSSPIRIRYLILFGVIHWGLLTYFLNRDKPGEFSSSESDRFLPTLSPRQMSALGAANGGITVIKNKTVKIQVHHAVMTTPLRVLFDTLDIDSLEEVPRRIEIDYEPFKLREPNFESVIERRIFFKNNDFQEEMKYWPRERLKGVVQIRRGGILSQLTHCTWNTTFIDTMRIKRPRNDMARYEILVPLTVGRGAMFHRFADDILPRIVQIYDILRLPNVKILITPPNDGNIYELLYRLNMADRIVEAYDSTCRADVIVHACVAPPIHPQIMQGARHIFNAPDRLQVHARDANVILLSGGMGVIGRKEVRNVGVLETLLRKRYGSKFILYKGGVLFEEMVEMFGKARIVIGLSDNVLYDLYFSPSDTHLIEIVPVYKSGEVIPSALAPTTFWHLTQMLGQPYWWFPVEPVSNHDIIVDIGKLTKILTKIDRMQLP